MKKTISAVCLALLAVTVLSCNPSRERKDGHILRDLSQTEDADGFFPSSTPRREGLDPKRLDAMLSEIDKQRYEIHSLMIVKNGKTVMDAYGKNRAFDTVIGPEDAHELHSVTKSVTSVLIGMAIEDGKIPGVDSRVMDWFTEGEINNIDAAKAGMTIGDLLTMRSGLSWAEGPDDQLFFKPPNSARSILSRPVVGKPGQDWRYSSGNSQILAEILRRATGKTPRQYADERLFGPLGISGYTWKADRGGTNYGGWGLFLKPRHLARFGRFCLKGGVWEGERLVSEKWMRDSTASHTRTPWDGGSYGYHWWIPGFGGFAARGYKGQTVYVFPDNDLMIIITAELDNERASSVLDGLVREFVLSIPE